MECLKSNVSLNFGVKILYVNLPALLGKMEKTHTYKKENKSSDTKKRNRNMERHGNRFRDSLEDCICNLSLRVG